MSVLLTRTEKAIEKLRKQKAVVVVEAGYTSYGLVRKCSTELGWIVRRNEPNLERTSEELEKIPPGWSLFWIDGSPRPERIINMKLYQKINHFPIGTMYLCRKHQLVYCIRQMERFFPEEYSTIIPKSFVLPIDLKEFSENCKVDGTYYIMKPYNDSQGRGIELFSLRNDDEEDEGEEEDDDDEESEGEEEEEKERNDLRKTKKQFLELLERKEEIIIQEYIPNPMLIHGKKFDLRIYVLLKSIRPKMKLFVFNEGLVRICSQEYEAPTLENQDNLFKHLTNYSINKKCFESRSQLKKEGSIIKQTFSYLHQYLKEKYGDVKGEVIIKKMWKDINDVIIKSFISVFDKLIVNYEKCLIGEKKYDNYACFEIIGIDILIDKDFRPWLLEGNVSPSFRTDTKVDYDCKHGVISETLKLLAFDPNLRKKCLIREKEKFLERMTKKKKRSKESIEKEMKEWVEKEEERHLEVENRELKNFMRIFPCEDEKETEKYQKFLNEVMRKKKKKKRRIRKKKQNN